MNFRTAAAFVAVPLWAACSDPPTAPEGGVSGPLALPSEAVLAGRAAFVAKCESCHNSGDGVDLAFFAFPDSAIRRRALAHVGQESASDIIAHVATLRTNPRPREGRLFQPGGAVLASDAVFGRALFPGDSFPVRLTTRELRGLSRLDMPVAIALPRWSVEGSDTDWLPDHGISTAVMMDNAGRPSRALESYRDAPTDANLLHVMVALFSALKRTDSPGPCHFETRGRSNARECFQDARWAATLVAQHLMRQPVMRPMADSSFYNLWWEVGESVRRAQSEGAYLESGRPIGLSWLYLGWMFGLDTRPTHELMSATAAIGLQRHGSWIALSSLVRRPSNSDLPFDDLQNLARYGHAGWHHGALRTAYTHLLERSQAGDLPPIALRPSARARVLASFNEGAAYPGMSATQRAELRTLSEAVANAIR